MAELFSEGFVPLAPRNFFAVEVDLHAVDWEKGGSTKSHPLSAKKYRLPLTTGLAEEEAFADVSLGWSDEGIIALVTYEQPFEKSVFPDIRNGDAIELLIDTRDVKSSGFNTRFCHHFFFLPNGVEGGARKGERTHFRTEDRHELCDPEELSLKPLNKKMLELRIPSSCLNGYNPKDFQRLGFSYRLSRWGGPPQHFSVSSNEYTIDQQPSLWSTLRLVP